MIMEHCTTQPGNYQLTTSNITVVIQNILPLISRLQTSLLGSFRTTRTATHNHALYYYGASSAVLEN